MVFIISDISKSLGLEWVLYKLKSKFRINVILINCNNTPFEIWLNNNQINSFSLTYRNKYLDFIPTILKILFILFNLKPKIVHCHLRKASLLGLIASSLLFIKKRIYTRHHGRESCIEITESLIDKLVFSLATDIISISNEIKDMTLEHTNISKHKVKTIHHGFNLSYFNQSSTNKFNKIKKKYNLKKNYFTIGAISRIVEGKNVDKIIDAFILYKINFNPKSILVIANVDQNSAYAKKVLNKLKCLSRNDYRLIRFEEDIFNLYNCFDLFIHIPKGGGYEAFGQTFIESMLSKVPTIFSRSGIANEICKNRVNTYFCNPENIFDILKGIKFYHYKFKNTKLITENAYNKVKREFELNNHISKLLKIYNK